MSEMLERQLVGTMLFEQGKETASALFDAGFTPDWLADPKANLVASTIRGMVIEGEEIIDIVTVTRELFKAGHDESVWMECALDEARTRHHARYYMDELRPIHEARQLADLAKQASTSGDSPDEIHQAIIHAYKQSNELRASAVAGTPLEDKLKKLVDGFSVPSEKRLWVPWPIDEMNRSIGRRGHELVYLAARPSVGKTAFIVQMMVVAAQAGIKVALKSLESPTEQILLRLLANLNNYDMSRLKRGDGTSFELERSENFSKRLKEILPLMDICDRPSGTAELAAWAQVAVGRGAKCLIIDNLKHISPTNSKASVVEQFRDYARCLKNIRDDANVPVIVIHHLSRDGQLAWSDDLERDGDIVLHLIPDAESQNEGHEVIDAKVLLEVRKNRDGLAGISHRLRFYKKSQSFSSEP